MVVLPKKIMPERQRFRTAAESVCFLALYLTYIMDSIPNKNDGITHLI